MRNYIILICVGLCFCLIGLGIISFISEPEILRANYAWGRFFAYEGEASMAFGAICIFIAFGFYIKSEL